MEEAKEALLPSAAAVLPPLPSLVPSVVPRLQKFKAVSSSNWINWKGRTMRALQILQVWDHVETDLSAARPDPLLDSRVTAAHLAAWDHAERIAVAQIQQNIDDTKLTMTRKCTTARQAWVALDANFVQASTTSRMSILNEINQYTFEPESTVLDHTNRLRALVDDLEESGGSMAQDQLVLYLLNSMPEEYDQTVMILRMQPPATLTLDYVCNALMAAETTFATKKRRMATSYMTQTNRGGGGGRSTSKPTGSSNRHGGPVCSLCDKPGHSREKCFQDPKVGYPDWWGSRPRAGEMNKRQKGGSTKKVNKRPDPPSPAGSDDDDDDGSSDDEASKRRAKKTKTKGAKEISFHTTVDSPDPDSKAVMAFMSTMNPPITSSGAVLRLSSSSQWVLDSGTTSHFCRDRSLLMNLTEIAPVTVRMGSATTMANARGTVVLWVSKDGVNFDKRVTLGNVLYVPDFSVNLMSVRKLARAGYGFSVMGNTAHLTMADKTPFAVIHGNDRDDLYVLKARTSKSCPATDTSDAGSYHTADSTMSAGGDRAHDMMHALNDAPHDAGMDHSAVNAGGDDRAHVMMQALDDAPHDAGMDHSAVNAGGDGIVCMSTVPSYVASVQTRTRLHDVTPLHLMHDRLNHLNVRQMVQMRTSDMVDGAHLLPSSVPSSGAQLSCESCIIGKSHRSTMPRKATAQRTTRCLQLVHSDVCGPVRCPSLGDECRYLLTFVDDYSRYVAIYIMVTKSEVLTHFKAYKAWAEKATGHRIATLRTDGGGEYTSGAFTSYLRKEGIQRQITPPHTPEHNGVAERMNLIIFGAVRSMLHRARLPATFWAEAARNAVYVRNRCPTRAVKGKTPYEMWTGNRPSIENIRVFGCLAYVHIDDAAKRTGKLDGRGFPCVFLGYSNEAKSWRLYNPESKTSRKRFLNSRDVTFLEAELVDIDGILASTHIGEGEKGEDLFPDVDAASSPSERRIGDDGMPALIPPPTDLDIFNLGAGDQPDADEFDEDEDGYDFLDTLPFHILYPDELAASSPAQQALYAIQLVQHQQVQALEEQMWALSTTVLDADEPTTYAEAMARPDANLWLAAIQAEYQSLQRTGTYELSKLPVGRHAIGCKWVFKIKRHADGSIDRYKARLVAKGFSQKEGLDYKETFAPVAKFASIRTLLALAAHQDYEVHQMDVKTAFLNGDLDVELYMRQPEGFVVAGQEELVCKLRKSLYGLKQAGRAWFEKINTALIDMDFTPLDSDHCVYVRHQEDEVMYIVLYVDDLLLIGSSLMEVKQLKTALSTRFEMTDLGEAEYVLGLQLSRDRPLRTLSLSQSDYIRRLLERFGMSQCNAAPTPIATGVRLSKEDCPTVKPAEPLLVDGKHTYASVVGAIMYAMLGTRPDLAFAIGQLTRFNSNPGPQHVAVLKRVLRYLRSSIDFELTYGAGSSGSSGSSDAKLAVFGYCDSDWGASIDDRRSVSGSVFSIAGGAVTWQAQKQKSVALSTVEAEYMAACQAAKDAVWLRAFLVGLGLNASAPTNILCDSQGAIALAKNPEHHQRSKHIDLRYHFVREQVTGGAISLVYTSTSDMAADQLTKPLSREMHNRCIRSMGLRW
jgi:transposase InsO family protein